MSDSIKRLLIALIICTGALFSCCGGGSSPAPPSPSPIPQIAGTYSGPVTDNSTSPPQQWSTWTVKYTSTHESLVTFTSCKGTLTFVQSGSSFTGSFAQEDGCSPVSGQVAGGAVQAGGGVTFSLVGPASDPLSWTGFTHCVAVTAGTMNFTGTVNGDHILDASFAQDALMQCPNDGTVSLNVRLRGSRQ